MLKEELVKDHARLMKLLIEAIKNKTKESLVVFTGNVRRHIEIENEILYGPFGQGELKDVGLKILDDHKQFKQMLNEVEQTSIDKVNFGELELFKAKFLNHSIYEDKYFYPALENLLTQDELADFIEQIRDEVNFAILK